MKVIYPAGSTLDQVNDTDCILVPTDKGMQVIRMHSIIRVQSLSNYSKLFFQNGKTLVVAKVLRWFEERLTPHHFVRIHRTHLVNCGYLSGYHCANTVEIELLNGERFTVSRRKKRAFLQVAKAHFSC